MIGGGEQVTFAAHLDQVRMRVNDTDGRLVASVLMDLPEAFQLAAELTNAQLDARQHEEAPGA